MLHQSLLGQWSHAQERHELKHAKPKQFNASPFRGSGNTKNGQENFSHINGQFTNKNGDLTRRKMRFNQIYIILLMGQLGIWVIFGDN